MRVLDNAIFVCAHQTNFYKQTRPLRDIKYVVIHYTGNKGDTARNNALYFREPNIGASAHYFVSGQSVYNSVPINHAAFAVGLGNRKEPYFKYPALWKKANNNNSVSIEICGYPNSLEADELTKLTAAKLAADLMDKLNLTPGALCRHYDITGKLCPAWAVTDPLKWLDFTILVSNIFYGEDDDKMKDTPENYSVFKIFMDRYMKELAEIPADWEQDSMEYCKQRGLINDGKPKSFITRGEFATVLTRYDKTK